MCVCVFYFCFFSATRRRVTMTRGIRPPMFDQDILQKPIAAHDHILVSL